MSQASLRGSHHPNTRAAMTKKHEERRTREYLTDDEIDKLIQIAKKNSRNPIRDQAMILLGYRHALRVTELCHLKWTQIDFTNYNIRVKRLKEPKGKWSVQHRDAHPLKGDEVRLLRKLNSSAKTPYLFVSNRGTPISREQFGKLLEKYGKIADFGIGKIHPHMLRHSCGYYLVNNNVPLRVIQEYLAHANINNTVEYTKLAQGRFDDLW